MVSKKDLNSGELKTMRTSRSPTTVTANGEVQTRQEATVHVKEVDLFVTVMLLEEALAVLSLGKLCEPLDKRSKTTSHQKWQKIQLCTICGSWFTSESSSTIPSPSSPSSSSQDSVFDANRYSENPVPERSGSTSEEVGRDPLHKPTETENKIKMRNAKKYTAIYCMTWRTGCRSSDKIWSMGVVLWSHGETLRLGIKTLPSHLMKFQWARMSTVFILTSRKTHIAISALENNKGFLQKTHWYRRAQSGKFGWLDHSGSQSSQWRKWITQHSSIRHCGTRFGNTVVTNQHVQSKTSQETQNSLMKFLEPMRKPKVVYTDNSLKFGKSCEELSWNQCTSTPHGSGTSGIAERAVRRTKEGTSAVLLQSGSDEKWWADSMESHCYLRNIQDLLTDGKTPYERWFGMPFNGLIHFGAMVEYHPVSAKDQSRLHQCGANVLPGILLCYALYAVRNLERRHYGRRHWRIGGDGRIRTTRQKAQCKGNVNAAKKWKLHIPSRRWNSQNLWVRTASETIHLDPASSGTRRGTRN